MSGARTIPALAIAGARARAITEISFDTAACVRGGHTWEHSHGQHPFSYQLCHGCGGRRIINRRPDFMSLASEHLAWVSDAAPVAPVLLEVG